jgi:hexosaminidase
MKTHLALGLTLFLALTAIAQERQRSNSLPCVIPTPQQMITRPEPFKPTARTRIVLGERTTAEDKFAAEQINVRLAELQKEALSMVKEDGLKKIPKSSIYLGSPQGAYARQWLKSRRISYSAELKNEGYLLDVSQDGIVIIGESATGRYYGVMTLVQLLDYQKKSLVVPGVSIHDWPQQKMRGITDDLSRGQVSTMENFKKIIRLLSHHKLNVYSPYIEDIFVFKKYPTIGKGRGEITDAEIKELDVYAKRYHVELIPTFETLGHWENILVQPEFVKYAEFPGAHTVNVSDEAVYTMLDDMIGQISDAFSSPYFNMAADESWDVGLGANKDRVAASDLATVHAEHYKRLFDILKKHKKKPMMYGDVILNNPTILDKIPKDVVIVDWHYGAQEFFSSPATFKSAGFPFVVSPAVWNFTGPFPNYVNTMINVQNLNRDGFRNGSLGLLTSNWNDYGGEALREFNYYGYAWTAECAWRPLEADVEHFNNMFFRQFFGNEQAGLLGQTAYALLSNPLNQINWNELWRHPMLPARQSPMPILWRLQSLESTMPIVRQSVARLQEVAPDNESRGRALDFVARLSRWFAHRIDVAGNVQSSVRDTTVRVAKDSLRKLLSANVRGVLAELRQLKEDFRALWLETNRSANLDLLMARYDRQISYWEETLRTFEESGTINDPLIESQWIYHPQAHPGKRDSSISQVPRAFFRKVINLSQSPTSAKMQLIGDTHARLWVNGKELGDVYARRSLSLLVEHQRVKMWEVGPLLKSGENIIAVEVANYNRFGSAGVNVYAELKLAQGITKILSDSTWKVAASVSDGWRGAEAEGAGWLPAVAKQYSNEVIAPNFGNGRLSWIER